MNVVEAMKHPDTSKDCMSVDIIDSLVKEISMAESLESKLEDIFKDVQPDLEEPEEIKELLKTPQEEEKPPKPELKPLPPSLKCVFLGEGDTKSSGSTTEAAKSRHEGGGAERGH